MRYYYNYMQSTSPENTKLSRHDAETEAVFLHQVLKNKSPDNTRQKILEAVSGLSAASEDQLNTMIAGNHNTPFDTELSTPFIQELAKVALLAKKNPEVFLEMSRDELHPRMLDLLNIWLDVQKHEAPETAEINLSLANLTAELEILCGSPEEFRKIADHIGNLAKSLREQQIRNAISLPQEFEHVSFSQVALLASMADEDKKHISPEVWGKFLAYFEHTRRAHALNAVAQ